MKKQFAVIGLGRFGASVAKTLYQMGHDVLAVDNCEAKVQELTGRVTQAIQADAHNEEVLKSLGIRNFDTVVVAIGTDIQANILVTVMLKEQGVRCIVAKAQNELHGKVLAKVGADKVVYPERDMGVRLAHNMVSTNLLDHIQLSPEYSILEVVATPRIGNQTLGKLNLRAKYGINVLALKNGDQVTVSPGADAAIHPDDIMVVLGTKKGIENLMKVIQ